MFRKLVIAAAALAASACSYGSAVDVAPFKDRPAQPVVADGDYCALAVMVKLYPVKPSEGCFHLAWQAQTRMILATDLKKAADHEDNSTQLFAIAPLGGGLYLVEVETPPQERHSRPDIYQISLFALSGNAFSGVPQLDEDAYQALAAKHPKLRFESAKPGEGALGNSNTWIAAGSPADIRAFLRGAAREAVRHMKPDEWNDVTIAVRDDNKAPDHNARPEQARDALAVVHLLRQLK